MQAREVLIGNNGIQNNPLPAHQNPQGHVNAIIHAHHDDLSPSTTQSKNMQATTTVTFSITSSLMKSLNFRHFFNQLGFIEELRKETIITLIQLA